MAITATNTSTDKAYAPKLSAATQASLEKGRQERAANAAKTSASKTESTTVSISNDARSKLEAEKSGAQVKTSSSTNALTYSSTATKFRTATAKTAQSTEAGKSQPAASTASSSSSKPQNVKFGSVDEAIAYGTRKANEQAASRNKALTA